MYDFDIAVLGGGPGGYIAAIRAAQYGKKVALIEARELGGTCLNRGCIPTKALLHCAEVYEQTESASVFGVKAAEVGFDYAGMAAYKDATVQKLVSGIEGLEKAYKVTVIKGFGRLKDTHNVAVTDASGEVKEYSFDKLILATGSTPARPPIEGIDGKNVVTSDEILSMTELPESFVIIGGGVIGIEFATLFATLGRPVTVIEMMPSILPGADADVVRSALRVLKKKKVSIINNAKVTKIEGGDTVTVTYELNGAVKTAEGGCCVVSVGRRAMTREIGLENCGIEMNRAFVVIDDHCRTNVENIYAIGDITGKIQLAHVASAQGTVAAANASGRDETMDYSIVPSCIYTNPEIAFVGLSEDKAKERGIEYSVGSYNVAGNGRSMVMNQNIGVSKLIADKNGKLIGAQLMCPRATDMIMELAEAIKLGASVKDVADTIHPHPTVSEVVMEAAHDWEGLCCHALPKRK
ncbi:MAG: dihydrolipoyl dehydrogenase [Clostridiales bacterium]|nr:dihydrolipoyl dehydrogenase [Clostridiales bacterium]